MSEVLHQYVVTKTGEQWCVFDCVGTLPHHRGEKQDPDVDALRRLSRASDSLEIRNLLYRVAYKLETKK